MRLNPRVLIAAFILLIGIAGYYGKSVLNPVTGEKQHISLTTDQEIALGLGSAPKMAEEFGGLDPDENAQALVQRVGERVMSKSVASTTPYKFQYHLLRDPQTVNAFALPGGPIFITRGLLTRLQNEAQLAGVLGHETGHVVARHSAEHMAQSQLGQSIVGAIYVGTSDQNGRGQQAAMMAAVANQMVQLKYGRQDELEADTLGVRVMSEAGYDPRALLGVMKILEEASGGKRQSEFMSSHPNPGNRQQVIEAAIEKLYPNGVPRDLTNGAELRHTKAAAAAQ
jgi:beta-barrel assembly-enhancing protease